jgi:glycosyltransferase involved in cell wall biosynthesis
LIANGVDPALFNPEADGKEMRCAWGLNHEFVAIYAGALGMANDIPTLLNAAKRLIHRADIRFVLIGDGKERSTLEELTARLGLSNVRFVGLVPKAQMGKALAAADVCVATLKNIPMFRTTYPNKVFDYMAAGRPTILCIDGVIREVIEDAKGGVFVSPGDDRALAEAIETLAQDKSRARRMGRAARDFVVRNFNRNTQASDFTRFVERFAESK